MTDYPPPVPLPAELAAVLSAAVSLNLYRDAVARAELELDVVVGVALAAGFPEEEVRLLAAAFRVEGGPYPPPEE